MKEGPLSSLWRLNLSVIQKRSQSSTQKVEWECVKATGKEIGKISHHTACLMNTKDVVFYGGLRGEDSNPLVYVLDLVKNIWTNVVLKVSKSSNPFRTQSAQEMTTLSVRWLMAVS